MSEQTSGSTEGRADECVSCREPRTARPGAGIKPGPLDPIADLCARLREAMCPPDKCECGYCDSLRAVFSALERLANTERLLRACMRHETARAERAEAERDILRAIVRAADALRIELFPHGVCCKCEHCVLVVAYDRARAKWGGES